MTKEHKDNDGKIDSEFVFCQMVHFSALRCSVVVLCGDLDNPKLKRKYEDECVRNNCRDPEKFEDIVSTCRMDEPYSGLTSSNDSSGDSIIHLPKWSSSVFVHEAHHAVCRMMKSRGIDDPTDEASAYCIEYLFNQIVDTKKSDKSFVERNA